MRHSILIHTTDPELYLILRYILEQAGHDVYLLPSIDMFLPDDAKSQPQRRTVLICLAMDDLLRSAVLVKEEQPDIRVVGFPLDNKKIDGVQSSVFDYLVRRPFDPGKLLEFLKFGLRCNTTAPTDVSVFLDDVEINVAAVRVRRGETHISLSPLHFRILLYLARNTDRVVSRDELITQVLLDIWKLAERRGAPRSFVTAPKTAFLTTLQWAPVLELLTG